MKEDRPSENLPERDADGDLIPVPSPVPTKELPSTISLLKAIRAGTINPLNLNRDDRRLCITHLAGEGYSNPEMAEILKISERTVIRDRRAIEESNAVERDPKLLPQMVGRLVMEADRVTQHVRRNARDRSAPIAVRNEAEKICWEVTRDLIRTLQELGHLPNVARELKADFTHHLGEHVTLETAKAEMERIITIQKDCRPGDSQMKELVEKTNAVLLRLLPKEQPTSDPGPQDTEEDTRDNES